MIDVIEQTQKDKVFMGQSQAVSAQTQKDGAFLGQSQAHKQD